MLVPIKVEYEDGTIGIEKVNPFHVVKLAFRNQKNVDKGTVILLRTGQELLTPEPFDIVDQKFEDVAHRNAARLFQQVITEYADQIRIQQEKEKKAAAAAKRKTAAKRNSRKPR